MKNFSILLCWLLLPFASFSQEQFVKVIKQSFRVNPLQGSFPAFLKAFTTDPDLLNKQIVKKSDSTFYVARGTYKVFNPFNFKANKVEVIFAENEHEFKDDNNKIITTPFYIYQIVVYTEDNPAHRNLLKKEYQRINKRLKRDLDDTEIISLKGVKNIEDGEITNYNNNISPIYPATLSWQTLSTSKQLVLTFMIRMQIINNNAIPLGFGMQVFSNDKSDDFSF